MPAPVGAGFQPARAVLASADVRSIGPRRSSAGRRDGWKPSPTGCSMITYLRRAGIFTLWNDRHRRSWLFISLRYATSRRPGPGIRRIRMGRTISGIRRCGGGKPPPYRCVGDISAPVGSPLGVTVTQAIRRTRRGRPLGGPNVQCVNDVKPGRRDAPPLRRVR